MCRSAWFGRLHAHHQELTTALTASGFTLERGGNNVVGRGLAGYITSQTTTNNATRFTRCTVRLWKSYRSCPKHESLSLHDPFPTARHLLSVSFIKILKANLSTALTKHNTTENNYIISHARNNIMYFSLEYISYLSQTREIRLSPAQTTVKVNCKLLSQYLYLSRHRSKPLLS